MHEIFIVVFGWITFSYYTYLRKREEPSSPIALARALMFLVLNEAFLAYLMWFLFSGHGAAPYVDLLQATRKLLSTLLLLSISAGCGFIAASTAREMQAANIRIFCGLGLGPHLLITFLGFPGGLFNQAAMLLFIPFVMLGGRFKAHHPAPAPEPEPMAPQGQP